DCWTGRHRKELGMLISNRYCFAIVATLAIACGSPSKEESTNAENGALAAARASAAPECKTGTHPETKCDPSVVRRCEGRPISSCEDDKDCITVCYEGTDCTTETACAVNGANCPVECVKDVPVEPGCYVGPDYLCYDGKTHQETNYDCCFPPGGGAE